MRHEIRKVPVPASASNGTPVVIKDLEHAMVVVDATGAGAFSIKLQAQVSGPGDQVSSAWFDLSAAIIASAAIPLDRVGTTTDLGGYSMPWTSIRVVSTTTGSPPPLVLVAGRHTRTQ